MASDAKTGRFDCGTRIDRLSNLPGDLIGHILKCLSLRDAARTSILSKAWRDIWVMQPRLIFDHGFFNQLLLKRIKKDKETQISEVSRIVSGILLAHNGPISVFQLCIPQYLPLHAYPDSVVWIRNISKNRVRKLKLHNKGVRAYEIPSYFFSCSELTHLTLNNCILNPPLKFGGFRNLIRVTLVDVTITTSISFGDQLYELDLERCTGIEHIGCQVKNSKNLTMLSITECGEVELEWLECTQKVEDLCLMLNEVATKIMYLDKLFDKMSRIHALHLDENFLKSLEPGAAVMERPITMEYLENLYLYEVELGDLLQIQYVLCFIRISPKLLFLYLDLKPEVESSNDMNLAASMEHNLMMLQYLKSPNLIGMSLNRLETVVIEGMDGSTELELIKLLLASSPFLKWMKLINPQVNNYEEAFRISQKLMKFPRASTAAQIIWCI